MSVTLLLHNGLHWLMALKLSAWPVMLILGGELMTTVVTDGGQDYTSLDHCDMIKTGCSCRLPNGSVINVEPAARTDGSPRYSTGEVYSYLYNPCLPFTIKGSTCTDAAVCSTARTGTYYKLGNQQTSQFVIHDGKLRINYTHNDYSASVLLTCSSKDDNLYDLSAGELSPALLELVSIHACPVEWVPPSTSDESNTGTIFLICVLGILVLYCVCGVLYLTVVSKRYGIERRPSYSCWLSLPGLIKDGIIFTYTSVKIRQEPSAYYESL